MSLAIATSGFYVSGGITTATFISLTPAPGPLAATPALARWTPVVMEYTVPAGQITTVIAQIGNDSALWMAAYDESLASVRGGNPFAPLFRERSSIVVVGDIVTGRTVTITLLPNGGWQRPDIALVPLVGLEVTP